MEIRLERTGMAATHLFDEDGSMTRTTRLTRCLLMGTWKLWKYKTKSVQEDDWKTQLNSEINSLSPIYLPHHRVQRKQKRKTSALHRIKETKATAIINSSPRVSTTIFLPSSSILTYPIISPSIDRKRDQLVHEKVIRFSYPGRHSLTCL